MATHDYVIANASGAAVRSDLNNALAAIVSNNSNATAPATTYAYMWWVDTTNGQLKQRNAANDGWIVIRELDGTLLMEDGSAASPGLAFANDLDTGFYRPTTNALGIATNGTNAIYVDASQRVGIGTNSVSTSLHVQGANTSGKGQFIIQSASAGQEARMTFIDGSDDIAEISTDGNNLYFLNETATGAFQWYTNGSERARIDSSGRLGIGTTSPGALLHTAGKIRFGSNPSYYGEIDHDAAISGSNIYNHSDAGGHIFQNSGTEALRIDASRRLLVGTSATSLVSKLVVKARTDDANGNASMALMRGSTPTTASGLGTIVFGDSNDNQGAWIYALSTTSWTSGSSHPTNLIFNTCASGASSPTERARITSSGLFGATTIGVYANNNEHEFIHNVDNQYCLRVQSNSTNATQYGLLVRTSNDQNDSTRKFIQCVGDTTERFAVRTNGGIANVSANNVNISDRNVKKDIAPVADTWDCLKEWEIVNFRYKDQSADADLSMGVIAQQVAESCPEVIAIFQEAKEATETEPAQEERIGVKEQQMMWMAVKALQEAQTRIEQLEAKVAALEAA